MNLRTGSSVGNGMKRKSASASCAGRGGPSFSSPHRAWLAPLGHFVFSLRSLFSGQRCFDCYHVIADSYNVIAILLTTLLVELNYEFAVEISQAYIYRLSRPQTCVFLAEYACNLLCLQLAQCGVFLCTFCFVLLSFTYLYLFVYHFFAHRRQRRKKRPLDLLFLEKV